MHTASISLSLVLFALFSIPRDISAGRKEKEVPKKGKGEQTTKIKQEMGLSLNDVSKSLVTITTSSGAAGTGFIVKDPKDQKIYLYTNQHVVRECDNFKAATSDNREIKLGTFLVSASRDIVRFLLPEEDPKNALDLAENVTAEEPIAVFGNSGGGGVFTSIYGRVVGVGPDRLEVSAKFIPGNSGSPVLNKDKKVVGIATYATQRRAKADWTVKGTRFSQVRRFAFKVDASVKWVPMQWASYQKMASHIADDKKSMKDVFDVAVKWVQAPYDKMTKDCSEMDLKMWVKNHNKFAAKLDRAIAKGYASDAKMKAINKVSKAQTIKNYKSLSSICSRRAMGIKRNVQKYGKALTPYLKEAMLSNAKQFESMAKEIEAYGKNISNKDAVVRKQ
jgi:hypothetical protein